MLASRRLLQWAVVISEGSSSGHLFVRNVSSGWDISPTVTVLTNSFLDDSVVELGWPRPVPVYGLPGYQFYLIHLTAIVSLSISILASAGVLIYMKYTGGSPSFWLRPIGERLVVYLAWFDLLFSISHEVDHALMLLLHDFPPGVICEICGFFVQGFSLAQANVVIFSAFSAFVMVVKEQRLPLGRYDWRLLSISVGGPFILLSIEGAFGYLGPGGPWCYVDMGEKYSSEVATTGVILICSTFFVNFICYLCVWLKIKQVSKSMESMDARAAANSRKYHKSAKIMMLFVAAYIGQWWAYTTFALWTFWGDPHIVLIVAAVFFTNMGGVFNGMAYTLVRRLWKNSNKPERKQTQSSNSNASLSTSVMEK